MRIYSLIIFIGCSIACYSQQNNDSYSISGHIPGMTEGKIYLAEFTINGGRDSAIIENGSFTFKGKTAEPTPYILSWERNFVNKPLLLFFIENKSIRVDVNKEDIRKSKVSGSPAAEEYAIYAEAIKPFTDSISVLVERRKKIDKDNKKSLDSIVAIWDAVAAKKKEVEAVFIKTHPRSVVSAWVITRSFIFQPDLTQLESLYNGLSPAVQSTSYAKQVKERLNLEHQYAPGQFAADFTQADTSGKMVSLKDFRGKYVLLDFWASWCVPCRMENPNVVAAYNKFKDKNFTVLSVSLDRPDKKDAWLAAIHKDGLTWTHVSDLKFWDNEVAKLYGINSVPSNFLVDPSGKIIAKNLEGEELDKKLEKLLP